MNCFFSVTRCLRGRLSHIDRIAIDPAALPAEVTPPRLHAVDAGLGGVVRQRLLVAPGAERHALDVLTPCMCCFGTLRQAVRTMTEDTALRARVARSLAADGLVWSGRARVQHVLPLLAREVGVDRLAAAVRVPHSELRLAAQYGCHALRPSDVTGIDNPVAPTLFEALIRAAGAIPVDWPRRLDCCGDPSHEANTPLAERMTRAKIVDAQESGADAICTACPHCHLRFDAVPAGAPAPAIRPLLVTQLVGVAMGLPAGALGLPDADKQRGDGVP